MTCSAFEIQFSSSFLFDLSLFFSPVFLLFLHSCPFPCAACFLPCTTSINSNPCFLLSFFASSCPSFVCFFLRLFSAFPFLLSSFISPSLPPAFLLFRRVLHHQHSFFITQLTGRFPRMRRCLGPLPGCLFQRFSGPCPRSFYLLKIFARECHASTSHFSHVATEILSLLSNGILLLLTVCLCVPPSGRVKFTSVASWYHVGAE